MSTAAAFLDAILHEPEEMSHRLVYADWLEEQGEPERAEFIRLQIERARLHPADPRARRYLRRETQLLSQQERRWLGPLTHYAARYWFHRGFVEEISISLETFLQHGSQILAWAPLRKVHLRDAGNLPFLVQQQAHGAAKLSELLRGVRELNLNRTALGDAAGLEFLSLPVLPQLEALHLMDHALSPAGVSLLADSPVLATLTLLEFNSTASSRETLEVLLRSSQLLRLQHLRLRGMRQGDRVVSLLLTSGVLSRLRSLSLGHSHLTSEGIRELASRAEVQSLESLDLSFNPLEEEGVRELLWSPQLRQLRCLNLSRTFLGYTGAKTVASSPLFGQLYGLDLSLNRIVDEGGFALAQTRRPASPGTLDLIYNPLGMEAREALRQRFGDEVCLFTR